MLETLFNFIKRLQHRCFPVNIAKFLRTAFYRTPLLAPAKLSLLNPKKKLFNKSLVMKTFKCPLPIDFAFIIPISTQNIQHSWRQHFFSKDFPVVITHQHFSFVYIQIKTYIAFTCVNPPLFLLPFTIFVLLPFSINF